MQKIQLIGKVVGVPKPEYSKGKDIVFFTLEAENEGPETVDQKPIYWCRSGDTSLLQKLTTGTRVWLEGPVRFRLIKDGSGASIAVNVHCMFVKVLS